MVLGAAAFSGAPAANSDAASQSAIRQGRGQRLVSAPTDSFAGGAVGLTLASKQRGRPSRFARGQGRSPVIEDTKAVLRRLFDARSATRA
jgi:hypothetical protein